MPDSTGNIKIRFSESVTFSQPWYEKFKRDAETYRQILLGKRDKRFD